MRRLKQLQERKAALFRDSKAILEKAEKENRELSVDEKSAYDKNLSEIGEKADGTNPASGLEADIAREERLANIERGISAAPAPVGELLNDGEAKKKIRIEGVHRKSQFFKSNEDAYLAGRYIRALAERRESDMLFCRDHGLMQLAATTAQSSTSNADGGLFMPDAMATAIIDLKETYGVFGRSAERWMMTGDTLSIPRRTGGMTGYYVGEGRDMTASKIAFDMVKLTARKYAAVGVYPKELADGATISIADRIVREAAYTFAKQEDEAGFTGDGTSTYGGVNGIVNALGSASIYTAASGNTSFETLDLIDFLGAVSKLPEYARPRAKWYISSVGYALSMANLMYAAGGTTAGDIAGGTQRTFLGFPVEISQSLNSTAGSDVSKVKCLLGDLSLSSCYGERAGFSVEEDRSLYFLSDQIAVKCTQRFDIVNHDVGTSSVAGPVVGLKTAAS